MLSVLMPAYNAEKFVEAAVYSVLDQTFRDFELLVVDDCSTDSTARLLSQIRDPRLRVLRNGTNLGIVGSCNRAAAEARGSYIARIDADDIAFPTRFSRQVDFLERNAEVSLLGTATFNLERGRISPGRRFDDADPIFIRWLIYLSNPIVHSSVMFRRELLDKTQEYLIEDFRYTEDFEFAHRILKIGEIAVLPEPLVIYRLHEENATRRHRNEMIERAGWVLARAYADLLGREATTEAALIARYVMAKDPVRDEATLHALGALIELLVASFIERFRPAAARRETIVTHAGRIWWDIVRLAVRSGYVGAVSKYHVGFRPAARTKIPLADAATSVVLGVVPARKAIAPLIRRFRRWKAPKRFSANGGPVRVEGVDHRPVALPRDEPPRLFVVVDTEAEFDWNGSFSRNLTRVEATASQESAQAIFDGFGLRPIYLVDYPVASQPAGYEPLRRILARGGCAIGAHLHTWTTPPFEEDISSLTSHGGNLPPDLEERKLSALIAAIEANFEVRPRFFKAGRYSIGRHTKEALVRHGFLVDFSILPMTDLRARGGPDFRAVNALSYRAGEARLLSVAMTRGQVGLLAPLPSRMNGLFTSSFAQSWRIPGILAKLNFVNMITLTPEGVPLDEQKSLIRSLLKAGQRTFVLHYHSPSLVPGNTPYVRTAADLSLFLKRLEGICEFVFHQLGGMPGNPDELLPPRMPS